MMLGGGVGGAGAGGGGSTVQVDSQNLTECLDEA